jgi:DNA-binding response OmpR family regulator
MNPPHILFIANDSALSTCYGEALATAGFHVSVAPNGEQGLRQLRELPVSAVVMDLILPTITSAELVAAIRAEKTTRLLPLIGLPTELDPFGRAASKAGLTKRLERFANPFSTVINAINAALNLEGRETESSSLPEPRSEAPPGAFEERIGRIRRSLQAATSQSESPMRFRALLQDIHDFSELSSLAGLKPVFQMASALEGLVFDLDQLPAGATPSAWRTMGQGCDFLATLLLAPWTRSKTGGNAEILVVDDDAGARQLIMAAVGLVGLSAASAATPATSLSMLSVTPFELIFLDIGLPKMNGFDLCAKVRSLPLHEKTPIVFLTGASSFQNRVRSSLSGGNDFVAKPFNLAELGVKALLWILKGQLCAV